MSIGSKKIRINIIMAIAHIPNIVNTSFWLISILFFLFPFVFMQKIIKNIVMLHFYNNICAKFLSKDSFIPLFH